MADFKKMTGIASLVINQKRFKLPIDKHLKYSKKLWGKFETENLKI